MEYAKSLNKIKSYLFGDEKTDYIKNLNRIRGCLFGGALGDSLGYPVEFKKVTYKDNFLGEKPDIHNFSDDTQMTLFTTEGIIESPKKEDLLDRLLSAYKYWYGTQYYLPNHKYTYDSLLFEDERLHHLRAPGNTCLNSLRTVGDNVDNNSIGCGGVMRVAPIGLVFNPHDSYTFGSQAAFLTHHGEMGYVPAGILSAIISYIMSGEKLVIACKKAMDMTLNEQIKEKFNQIIKLIESDLDDISCINMLGEGWVGDEALYIAMFCALRYNQKLDPDKKNFWNALKAAVTHDGDSDSTGAICGNILGAYYGIDALPVNRNEIECSDIIEDLSVKLILSREKFLKE